MGTLSRRGRHFEVASTTSDDENTADWPAGGQKPGIPQEEERAASEDGRAASEDEGAASEDWRAASEDGRAAKEDGGAASEEKGGGGGGRRGQPHKPEDNSEDGGQTHWPGMCGDDARVVPEPTGTRPEDSGTGDHREDLHRASHGPGGSWLWKLTTEARGNLIRTLGKKENPQLGGGHKDFSPGLRRRSHHQKE
ncbi:hypothetical protein NDU88_005026 [Pleurodeles waltl]|uniref:Uncharacterized protein n=1 Tax=Pleurodeles waltl TaxID=8319 RepID=A0AAV7QEU8_PLEWA|nr:hypothetical protein NDU88_005026 [Pleurodeles waltl]